MRHPKATDYHRDHYFFRRTCEGFHPPPAHRFTERVLGWAASIAVGAYFIYLSWSNFT